MLTGTDLCPIGLTEIELLTIRSKLLEQLFWCSIDELWA